MTSSAELWTVMSRRSLSYSAYTATVFVTDQSAVDRLPQQWHELVLLVGADSTVLERVLNHIGQRNRLIEFTVDE